MGKNTNLEHDMEKMFAQCDSDGIIIYRNLFQNNETALILQEYGYGFDNDANRTIFIF